MKVTHVARPGPARRLAPIRSPLPSSGPDQVLLSSQTPADRVSPLAGRVGVAFGSPALTGPHRSAPRIRDLPPRTPAATLLVGRPERPDPHKRNVIVFDGFRVADNHIAGTASRSHGEAIARPLETQGYNVYRVQNEPLERPRGKGLEGDEIHHLADRIQNGEIPARRGDIVNMSFGQDRDMTFSALNRLLGYRGKERLTAANLDRERVALLRQRLKQRLEDPSSGLRTNDRKLAKGFLRTADGIDRLRRMGLIVVNAAGNEGPHSLHPGFLNSNHMLQNRNGDGTFDQTSARHALTEPARGTFVSRRLREGGVDVNNDGIADFGPSPQPRPEQLSGTSFAVLEFLRRRYPPDLSP